ncbi:hypothetical protein EJ04DRAFT_179684 [Polyplosphaeria fusca]|uniref:Uncharacterized protein n=1 Tax=Polyplosphaeria fusca TaxID=682080 RepID=A0A9P4R2W6_9PLEO|nr:hypothetical protein EJ04DRAFT_179684 [Polyplosphaeria fusca]
MATRPSLPRLFSGPQLGRFTPVSHPLLEASRGDAASIDTLLRPHLYSPSLPQELEACIRYYVSTAVTPGLYSDESPDRPPWYYANCLVHGTLLGRAYALLSTPTRPPRALDNDRDFPFARLPAELRLQIWDCYKRDLAQAKRFWLVMTRVFIKALWSGRDPEEGSRYIAGVLVLCAGHALATNGAPLRGYGKKWVWWDDRIAGPEHAWGWDELREAIMATKTLSRENTDIVELRRRWERAQADWHAQLDRSGNRLEERERLSEERSNWLRMSEYVSRNVLEVLDLAREHLRTDERDWTPPELAAKFLRAMFEGNEQARQMWEATGSVQRALYQTPEDGAAEYVDAGGKRRRIS